MELPDGTGDQGTVTGRLLLAGALLFHWIQQMDLGLYYDIAFKILTLTSLMLACLVYYKKLKRK